MISDLFFFFLFFFSVALWSLHRAHTILVPAPLDMFKFSATKSFSQKKGGQRSCIMEEADDSVGSWPRRAS